MSDQINKETVKKLFDLIDKQTLPIPDLDSIELADENDPQGYVVGKNKAGAVVMAMPRSVFDALRKHKPQPLAAPPLEALRSANNVFGQLMSALNARSLLKKGIALQVIREKFEKEAKTDAELAQLAADGFEASALALAAAGDKSVTIFECGGDPEL